MGALIPLIVSLAPYMAQWVGLGGVMAKAGDIVERVTGTRDPIAAASILQDPAKAAELQIGLARISAEAETERRRIELDTLRAELENADKARQLASHSPLVAWTQVASFAVVLGVWCAMVLRVAWYGLPAGNEGSFAIVLSTVSGVLGGYIQFFIGNATSAGAANRRLDMLASMATNPSSTAAVATTGDVSISTTEDLNAASLARSRGGRDEGPSRARSLAP